VNRVSWTKPAFTDLEDIHTFLARNSESYARFITEGIVRATERLEPFPLSGRIVPEYGRPDICEVFHQRAYRIVYRVLEHEVHVLMVYRAERPLPENPPV
jgi:plasmid stabilization system protein ParE